MKKIAYLIKDIAEYGKLISYCIENDINVWRTYWNEHEAGNRCYQIDWKSKKCFYSRRKFFEEDGFEIIEPQFRLTEFGIYEMEK